ncbi:hypothetical protein NDU88_001872 [Pleurodeles waltl]|uniref:Uncharacterized protein n=1 Tax=Pleurodeles waltl TaxID=8319 RepID=A0AAV7VY08_PLEWA|nr:hypothetical protein NDU88_001872 [Pleurodeles waltl]
MLTTDPQAVPATKNPKDDAEPNGSRPRVAPDLHTVKALAPPCTLLQHTQQGPARIEHRRPRRPDRPKPQELPVLRQRKRPQSDMIADPALSGRSLNSPLSPSATAINLAPGAHQQSEGGPSEVCPLTPKPALTSRPISGGRAISSSLPRASSSRKRPQLLAGLQGISERVPITYETL